MGFATQFAVPLLAMVLFRNLIKRPVGTLFLEGLSVFLPPSAPLQQPPPTKTTKKDRKMLQKRQLAFKGIQSNVYMQQISPSALHNLYEEPATYGSSFEALGVLLLMLLGGVVCHFTLGPLFGLWQDVFMWSLCPMVVGWAVHQLLVLQTGGSLLRLAGDRAYIAATAVTAAAAAYLLLVAAPRGWLCWDVRQAAAQLDELWNLGGARVMASRLNNPLIKALGLSQQQLSAAGAVLPGSPPQLRSDPMGVAAGLAAVAGVLAASLMGSCSRMARLYSHISPVPQWAEQYLSPPAVVTAVLRLALAVPLMVVVYGVKPMAGFLAGGLGMANPGTFLSGPAAGAAGVVGPALLLATSLLFIFAIRPLAAAHLGTGLLEWHVLRHSDTTLTGSAAAAPPSAAASASVKEVRDMVARRRLNNVYATVCQTALQLLGPAAILTALLLMYGAAAGSLDHLRPAAPLLLPPPANTTANATAAAAPAAAAPPAAPAPAPAPTGGLEGMEEVVSTAASAVTAAAGAAAKALAAGELPPMPSLAFITFATSFLSWFCCVAIVVFTYPMLFIYRTGMHIG